MSRAIRVLSSLIALLLALLAGCPGGPDANTAPSGQRSMAGIGLRLAVVDDPGLAAAADRLRGEWNAQTGATLEVVRRTEAEMGGAESLPFDAVLCPSHLMGVLAERNLLAAVPQKECSTIRNGGNWFSELLRLHETV